ncbi:hypothetical protein CF327_g1424 [Tilletia walkeri]|nr:hypothetical protein CF327_g1424 [Tilletia walkeri]
MRKTVRSYPRCVGPSSSGTSAAGVRNDPTSTRQDWCSAPTTGAAVAPSSSTESWPPANSVSSAWSRFLARRSPTPVTSKQHDSHTVGCPSPSIPVSVQPMNTSLSPPSPRPRIPSILIATITSPSALALPRSSSSKSIRPRLLQVQLQQQPGQPAMFAICDSASFQCAQPSSTHSGAATTNEEHKNSSN